MKNFVAFIKQNILSLFVFLIILFFIAISLQNWGISGDDLCLGFINGDIVSSLLFPDHGRFIQSLQLKTLYTLIPEIFSIHPNSLSTIIAIVFGLNFAFISFFTSLLCFYRQKKTFLFPIVSFIVFIFYMRFLWYNSAIDILNVLSYNLAYVFGPMMFIVFYYILCKLLLNPTYKVSKRKYLLFCILSFITALNDTIAYIGLFSIFTMILLSLSILIKRILVTKSFLVSTQEFYKKYYHVIYLLIIFIIGASLTILSTSDNTKARFLDNSLPLLFLIQSFIPAYLKAVIIKHKCILIPIFTCYVLCFFSFEKHKNVLFISTSMLSGILLFFFALVKGGTNTFYEQGEYWVWHIYLQCVLWIILVAVLLLLVGSLMRNSKIMSTLLCVIFICFLLKSFCYIDELKNFSIGNNTKMKEAKTMMYVIEKMYLFYAYNHKNAILPISALNTMFSSAYCTPSLYEMKDNIPNEIKDGNPNLISKDNCESVTKQIDCLEVCDKNDEEYKKAYNLIKNKYFKYTSFRYSYMKALYHLKENERVLYYFTDDTIAMEKFKEMGGVLTPDEIQKLNFSKLKDKNFVLNIKQIHTQ